MKFSIRLIATALIVFQFFSLNAESKEMRSEKYISLDQSAQFEDGLEITLGQINNIEYILAPGGKVTGLKLPSVLTIPLTLMDENGRLRTELKVSPDTPNPHIQWNSYLVTFVSIEPKSTGFKIKIRSERAKLPALEYGGKINRFVSGEILDNDQVLLVRHAGYVNAHRASNDGTFSSDSSCMIEISDKVDKQTFYLDVPLRSPIEIKWKKWILTFKKTDSNGGMSQETPVEFEVKEKQ